MITPQGERDIRPQTKRQGIVYIDQRVILDWLQFKDGVILGAQLDINTGSLMLKIEHPDMPDSELGWQIPQVTPIYQIEHPSGKITRTAPKRSK